MNAIACIAKFFVDSVRKPFVQSDSSIFLCCNKRCHHQHQTQSIIVQRHETNENQFRISKYAASDSFDVTLRYGTNPVTIDNLFHSVRIYLAHSL